MRSVFLFSWDVERSAVRDALAFADVDLSTFAMVDGRVECPIRAPPHLSIVEPEPLRSVATLIAGLASHPVVGRAPKLVVLDPAWVTTAARMPIHDFLVRGFAPSECIARVQRLLGQAREEEALILAFDGLEVDVAGFEVRQDGAPIALTPQEFALLSHLCRFAGRVHNREALLNRVWGRSYAGGARTVDIHVRRIRAKLGDAYADRLQTVRGVGYKWLA